jgi:malonyl-CoA O-methyltransferase
VLQRLRQRIDAPALARTVRRLQAQPPWLHAEVARRLGERLQVILQSPGDVLDWSAGLGASQAVLRQAYPKARHTAVAAAAVGVAGQSGSDPALARPRRRWWPLGRGRVPGMVAESAVAAAGAQLVWSNMALHFTPDLPALLAAWQRALAPGGFVMFATLGPGSLPELRDIYAAHGWGVPHTPFVDMHDLGDMLVEAGFADPVMDQERLTLTYPDARAALAELRTLGANLDPARHAGLRTPAWRDQLLAALDSRAVAPTGEGAAQRIPLQFEVVYGHAWRVQRGPAVAADTRVGLDDMRQMLRLPRRAR